MFSPPLGGGKKYDKILRLGEEIWIYEEKKLEWNKIAGYLIKSDNKCSIFPQYKNISTKI